MDSFEQGFYKHQTYNQAFNHDLGKHKGLEIGVYVFMWGRDCDGVEASNLSFVEAKTYEQYLAEETEHSYSAEGPWSWQIIPIDRLEEARESCGWRDTFAEKAGY